MRIPADMLEEMEKEGISELDIFMGFIPKPNGKIQFTVIVPNAEEVGIKMLPEGIYKNADFTDNQDNPMFARAVVEDGPKRKSQTWHIFANSTEGAKEIHDIMNEGMCEGKIKPVCTLEDAPPEILSILSKKRQRLIKKRQK